MIFVWKLLVIETLIQTKQLVQQRAFTEYAWTQNKLLTIAFPEENNITKLILGIKKGLQYYNMHGLLKDSFFLLEIVLDTF